MMNIVKKFLYPIFFAMACLFIYEQIVLIFGGEWIRHLSYLPRTNSNMSLRHGLIVFCFTPFILAYLGRENENRRHFRLTVACCVLLSVLLSIQILASMKVLALTAPHFIQLFTFIILIGVYQLNKENQTLCAVVFCTFLAILYLLIIGYLAVEVGWMVKRMYEMQRPDSKIILSTSAVIMTPPAIVYFFFPRINHSAKRLFVAASVFICISLAENMFYLDGTLWRFVAVVFTSGAMITLLTIVVMQMIYPEDQEAQADE